MDAAFPIPGYSAYTITKQGQVFYNNTPKVIIRKPGRSLKVRLQKDGITRELGLAKLLAECFIPNPENHARIIFKDGDHHHCQLDNIQWVSHREFVRLNLFPHKSMDTKATPRKPKIVCQKSAATPSMPDAIEIPGIPGYFITPQGEVWHKNKLVKPQKGKPGKSLIVSVRINGKIKNAGLGRLLATTFLPNPHQYTRIIFKDRDNRNCIVSNIAWASAEDYNIYTESFKARQGTGTKVDQVDPAAMPVPGYPGYLICPLGKLYCKDRLLSCLTGRVNRSPRVKIRNKDGKRIYIILAKLVAITFIPNPGNKTHIIFKDRDQRNAAAENLQWASKSEWLSAVKYNADSEGILGPPKRKLEKPKDWIDPERVPVEGYPGYYITPSGVIYKKDRIIKPVKKPGKSLKARLYVKINGVRMYRFLGLATLLAEHFIPNPRKHRNIIFKDRDNQHCVVDNIAWVDGETFMYYASHGKYKAGGKKIVVERKEAIRLCNNELLRNYYITLDEEWLHECWQQIDNNIYLPGWPQVRSECFIYFVDRAKRFSLLKNPTGLMIVYAKGMISKLRKEISPDIPVRQLLQTDESLRNFKSWHHHEDR